MREHLGPVRLEGRTLHVTAHEPLPVQRELLVLAAAIRIFERYPILERLVVMFGEGGDELAFSRDEIDRLLGPEGFAALRVWGGWRQVLARAVQAYGVREGRP